MYVQHKNKCAKIKIYIWVNLKNTHQPDYRIYPPGLHGTFQIRSRLTASYRGLNYPAKSAPIIGV